MINRNFKIVFCNKLQHISAGKVIKININKSIIKTNSTFPKHEARKLQTIYILLVLDMTIYIYIYTYILLYHCHKTNMGVPYVGQSPVKGHIDVTNGLH